MRRLNHHPTAAALVLIVSGGCVPRSTTPMIASPGPQATPRASAPSPPAPPSKAPRLEVAPEGGETRIEPRCPEDMALIKRIQGPYCIDRWEASVVRILKDGTENPWPGNRPVDGIEHQVRALSLPATKPQGYISGDQASLACQRAGKRLCEIDEWVRACRGPGLFVYPYGNERRKDVCNDRFRVLDHHPVPILFRKDAPAGSDPKLMWDPRFMNDPRLHEMRHTIVLTGAFERCTNDYGVFDMVGNLHEWVADPDGTFFGGFFMDTFQNGQGCEYRTIAHPFDYHDYSTGFRCCSDAFAGRSASSTGNLAAQR